MKCDYCGTENEEKATTCQGCGQELSPPPPSESVPPWVRIAVIDNEVEAELLDRYLDEDEIPHVMVSYSDAAFSGIYQTTHGWGHVEAAAEDREEIEAILKDIRDAATHDDEKAG
jgi:hypothetical protein